MKWAHSDFLDGGLAALKANAIKLLLIKAYSAGDSYATVTGNKLAEVTMASTDYTIASNGNDRQVTTAAGKSANATASSNQYDNGTATSGSATTLADTSKSWTVNAHANKAVVITGGTGAGQYARISSNTATVLTLPASAFATAPDATSTYKIVDDLHYAFTDGAAKVLYVTDETTNQVVTSGNPINFPQLTYNSSQPV